VIEPSGSPSFSSSPLSEILSEESFTELPESLEDQGVELRIVLRVQPLSSHPLATFNNGSSTKHGISGKACSNS